MYTLYLPTILRIFSSDKHTHEYLPNDCLTHWGRVTDTCVSKLTIIGSDKGLSPGRRQAIIWTNAGILLIRPLETNFSEIWIKIHTFSIKKIPLKMSSGKWRPFCLGLNELNVFAKYTFTTIQIQGPNDQELMRLRLSCDGFTLSQSLCVMVKWWFSVVILFTQSFLNVLHIWNIMKDRLPNLNTFIGPFLGKTYAGNYLLCDHCLALRGENLHMGVLVE